MIQIHFPADSGKALPNHIDIDGSFLRFARRYRLPIDIARLVAELAALGPREVR